MNKKLYVGIYAVTAVLGVIGCLGILNTFLGITYALGRNVITDGIGLILSLSSIFVPIFLIVHIVFNFLMLAKMWGAIQDGQTEITVGKAIGYLFIPIFSFYWVFRAWGSFPTEYNKFIGRHGIRAPQLSGGLFITFPILLITAFLIIPFLILPIVFVFIIAKVCDAVNNLNQAKQT